MLAKFIFIPNFLLFANFIFIEDVFLLAFDDWLLSAETHIYVRADSWLPVGCKPEWACSVVSVSLVKSRSHAQFENNNRLSRLPPNGETTRREKQDLSAKQSKLSAPLQGRSGLREITAESALLSAAAILATFLLFSSPTLPYSPVS